MDLIVPSFSQANMIVVGDLMLDRTWHGSTTRISPEAPVPVVHVKQVDERPGGAGNVALNIAALGATVSCLGICGDDREGEILEALLKKSSVEACLLKSPNVPTITKLRVMSLHQQLLRMDFEEALSAIDSDFLVAGFLEKLHQASGVLLSDYGKGSLSRVREFIESAREVNVPVFVDPKGSDFDRYRGATLITPNKKEFEVVVGECVDEKAFEERGTNLLKALDLKGLLVTRGSQGMTLFQQDAPAKNISVRSRDVFDVTGAGDTVISVAATAYAAGNDLVSSVELANLAASISVGKLGTATVTADELQEALKGQTYFTGHVLSQTDLSQAITQSKAIGERVVFTNGCFDILHAGHVRYLQQAKELGDRLIVAVNDDASVKRQKGPERPLNSLQQRMEVLASLNAVDWVVPFSDDTPIPLLDVLKPDILVKGGDYDVAGVVGHEVVQGYGGEVQVLSFVDGCSTTQMVDKIKSTAGSV